MAETLGIVTGLLGPAIELGKYIVSPFRLLRCFNSNIHILRDEAKKLDDAREGLQMQVDRERNNVRVIVPEVETWLRNANDFKDNIMPGIEDEISHVRGGCLTMKARFSLSKRAKETAEAMKELRGQSGFPTISVPAAPAATEPVPLGATDEFESRKRVEEDIMAALRDGPNTIVICGMGGIGKTTMAKRIAKRVMEEHLFDEVVNVVVGQRVDGYKIQLELAERLSLNLEEKTLSARAHKLRARLTTDTKRILIVLDDVWENLILEDLGIPCDDSAGCTVVITSRNKDVLSATNVIPFELQILTEEEAWLLFRENVGTCVDNSRLKRIAKQVMEECHRLPIALIIVAGVLKNENNLSIWRDVLQQLRRSNPRAIPAVISRVYNPLKLSYDFLDDDNEKSLLLLCCLFPEDDNIPLYRLTESGMGLNMFEGITNLEEAKDRTHTLVKRLKNRFLLLDGQDDDHATMHDVVRDVCIFIASNERRINCNDCTWISSFMDGRAKSSNVELGFPNLRLLWIDNKADGEFQINDSFIEETTELNVLMIDYGPFRSLPHATKLLKNLRTLVLYKCRDLETISIVGELESLEIFICHKCESIEEVPAEIGRLNRLRLLQLSKCQYLETVEPGVISSLSGLEELKMVKSFDKWEATDETKERKNAGLSELESLSNLTCLEIEVEDSTLAAQNLRLSQKIVKYNITIGEHQKYGLSSERPEKKMTLRLEKGIKTLGNWIHECVKSVEFLCLTGDACSNLDLAQAQEIRSLTLKDCSTMEKLVSVTTSSTDDDDATVFPLLECLQLDYLPDLQEICHIDGSVPKGSTNNSFKSLKELRLEELPKLKHLWRSSTSLTYTNLSSIYIQNCNSLRSLFSLSTAKDCLSQLQTLDISDCEKMEQIFVWNDEDNINNNINMVFPKLEKLRLCDLPSLTTFCKGIRSMEFPLLTYFTIMRCPELKSVVTNWEGTSIVHDDDDHSLHLLCRSKVAFGSLEELNINGCKNTLRFWCHKIPNDVSFSTIEKLRIDYCGKIISLFSSPIAQSLVNLRRLKIRNCGEMVKVIEDEEEEEEAKCRHAGGGEMKNCCLFPKLRYLELRNLSKLEIFCLWRSRALEMPLLESVFIQACPQMIRFSLGSLTTPKLNTIKIDVGVIDSMDINGALQQH